MGKPKVLVVEDDGIIAADIQHTLKKLGYDICGAVDSGEKAIETAGIKKPDLILMDILLHGNIDGIEAARDILEQYKIPVVYLSAHEDDNTIERTRETRPYGFILKPFSERDLKATLKMALFQHDAERKLQESEERYFRLTENARDMIFRIKIPEGTYEYVNRASIDILGYSPEEFYSRPILMYDILHPEWKHYFKVNWERLLEGDLPPVYEFQVISKCGEARWLNQRNVLVTDKEGKPEALEGVVTDITEQKRAEALIRKQHEEYRLIFDSVPAMIWYKDDNNKMLRVNKLAAQTKGCTVEQMEGKYTEEFYPDEAANYLKDDLEVVRSGKPKLGIVEKHQIWSGEKIWIKTDKLPYRNEKGEVIGVLVFALDISRQKEIEEQLLKAEHRNALILNTIPDLLFQFDCEGKFIDYKAREEKELLFKPSEFLNKNIKDVLPADIADKTKIHIKKVLETRKPELFEYELRHNGNIRVYEARLAVSGDSEVLAIVRDITSRSESLRALKASEEKYKRLTNNAPIALTRLPINEMKYEFVNNEFVRQSGYTLSEFNNLTNDDVSGLIHPEDREIVRTEYDKWAKNGFNGVKHIVYRIRNKTGCIKWLDSYHYADFDDSGKIIAINQIYIDVTEQKKTEESLKVSEAKFRAVTEIAPVTIYILQGTKFIYGNRFAEELTGYKNDELTGKEFWEIIHPDDRERAMKTAEGRQKGEIVPNNYELRIVTKQGTKKIVQINAALFEYEGKPAVLGTALDITERKKAEASLTESEEMFRALAESMPAEIIVYQGDKFVYVNPFAETLTGFKVEEIMNMKFWEKTHPDYREIAKVRGYRRLKGEKVLNRYELKLLTKGGGYKWVDYSAVLISYKGKPAVLGTAVDITASKTASEALRKSEERYKAFIHQIYEGIYRVELNVPVPVNLSLDEQFKEYFKNAYVAECNDIMARMYGFEKAGELVGKPVSELLIINDPHNVEYMKVFINNGYKVQDYESHEVDKDKKPVYFLNNGIGIVENGKLVRVWGTQRDITEIKRTEEKLKESLFEKEILLKEIHHRVKNNLQIITSLLKLQATFIKDSVALELFKESQDRIQSMSLVHQKLYQSKDLGRINFGEYTRTLVSHLSHSLGVNAKRITVNVDSAEVFYTLDSAVPCGLIINELLTNSIKHAFKDRKKGLVWVRVKQQDSWNIIEVTDDGIGLPENFDIKKSASFGMRLVSTLIEQLKGKIQFESDTGSSVRVLFPSKEILAIS